MNAPIDPGDRNPIKDVYAAAHKLSGMWLHCFWVTPSDNSAVRQMRWLTDQDAADLRKQGYIVEEL